MLQNYYLSLFLQLLLAVFAYAAPIADEISTTVADPWQYGTGGGIIGFIVLVLDILVWSTSLAPPEFSQVIYLFQRKHANCRLQSRSSSPTAPSATNSCGLSSSSSSPLVASSSTGSSPTALPTTAAATSLYK